MEVTFPQLFSGERQYREEGEGLHSGWARITGGEEERAKLAGLECDPG